MDELRARNSGPATSVEAWSPKSAVETLKARPARDSIPREV